MPPFGATYNVRPLGGRPPHDGPLAPAGDAAINAVPATRTIVAPLAMKRRAKTMITS
jgi:hypothetical protein